MNLENLNHVSAVKRMEGLDAIQAGPFPPKERFQLEVVMAYVLETDSSPIVRHEAAFVIASLKSRDLIDGYRAYTALCRAMEDDSILVRHEVALAFAAFPGGQTEKLLWDLVGADPSEDVALSAEFAIEELGLANKLKLELQQL
jgi:HEAT repeat protein